MPVPERDYRFNFPRNIAIYPQTRFRFAGIEYIATRIKTEGGYKKVRAAIALEPSENAQELDGCGERDPEGSSWTDLSLRWTREQTAELLRRLSDTNFARGIADQPGLMLERGAEIMHEIAGGPATTSAEVNDVAPPHVPGRPNPAFGPFITDIWRCAWKLPRAEPPVQERHALSSEERLFMFRSAARIEAEIVYLRNNSQMVCQVFQETKRASLGYTTALEMALICVARELEDERKGKRQIQAGIKTAGEIGAERGQGVGVGSYESLVSFRCPACAADFFPTLRPHAREANILHTTCPGCRGELRLFRTGMPDGSWAARLLSNP